MFTIEEKKQLEEMRWKMDSRLETHIKPVEDGYVISTVERFLEGDVIVAQATFTKVAHNGLDVANYIFNLYTTEYDKEPADYVTSPPPECAASVPEAERYEPADMHDHYEVPVKKEGEQIG